MEIKPQAMAISPDTNHLPQGKYGPIYPKTPACYGFSILAKIIPGREPVFHEYAKNIENALKDNPAVLAQIHPGQTMNLDYSVTHTVPLPNEFGVQIGLVGYNQWQTTDKTGPAITPAQAAAHYRVNAVGFAANVNMPARVNVGVKYFKEFANRSTFQGYSFQLSGAISF